MIWRYNLWICGSRGHLQDILLVLHMVDLLKADDVVEAENLDLFFGPLLFIFFWTMIIIISFIHYYYLLDKPIFIIHYYHFLDKPIVIIYWGHLRILRAKKFCDVLCRQRHTRANVPETIEIFVFKYSYQFILVNLRSNNYFSSHMPELEFHRAKTCRFTTVLRNCAVTLFGYLRCQQQSRAGWTWTKNAGRNVQDGKQNWLTLFFLKTDCQGK